jgi:hypothetical protein
METILAILAALYPPLAAIIELILQLIALIAGLFGSTPV